MKTKRGLPFFRPLDKSAFARAPAGWCSWYVFWQGIREEQVTANTDWLAANLKQFGCQYVQIDDGWQGVGQGDGVNRDWYVTEKNKFPHGMKWLADYIRAKGLKPGIWLIPFATSDAKALPRAARVVRPPARRQQRLRDARRQDGQDRGRLDRPLRGRSDLPQGPNVVPRPVPHDLRRLGLRLREDRRSRRLGRRLPPLPRAAGRSEDLARRRLSFRPGRDQVGDGSEAVPAQLRRRVRQLRILRRDSHRRRRGRRGLGGDANRHPGHHGVPVHEQPGLLDRSRRGLRPAAA